MSKIGSCLRNGRKSMGISLRVAAVGVQKMFRSVSFTVLLVFMFSFWYLFGWNIKSFAVSVGYGVTPFLLPHFFASGVYGLNGKLLLVLVTCGAPFLDAARLFTVKRCGRTAWCAGQMIFIVLANMIFALLMFAVQIITLLPWVAFSGSWGSVLRTIAEDSSVLQGFSGYGSVYADIIEVMTPLEATTMQMVLCVLLGCIFGAASFLINGLTGKNIAGVLMVGAVIGEEYVGLVDFYFRTNLVNLVPSHWLSLSGYVDGTFDFGTNVVKMLLMIAALMAVCLLCVKKQWIRTTE